MVYARKRGMRRIKRSTNIKRLAKGKETTITTLAKSIRSLQRKFKKDQQYLNYSQTWANSGISSTYTAFHLNDFSSWGRIFGTTSNDDTDNGVIWKSSGLDMKFDIGNEPANVNFTIMLLQCKDTAKTLIGSSGALTLTNGDTHYTQSGLTMVNKKFFNILKIKRFSLGNNGQSASISTAQTQFGTDRRFYMKLRPNKKIVNPTGDWKNLTQSLDPSGNYYLVCFSDNSSLDLESPVLNLNAVHTVQTL